MPRRLTVARQSNRAEKFSPSTQKQWWGKAEPLGFAERTAQRLPIVPNSVVAYRDDNGVKEQRGRAHGGASPAIARGTQSQGRLVRGSLIVHTGSLFRVMSHARPG